MHFQLNLEGENNMIQSKSIFFILAVSFAFFPLQACSKTGASVVKGEGLNATTAKSQNASPDAPAGASSGLTDENVGAPIQIPTVQSPAQNPQPAAMGTPKGFLRDIFFNFDSALISEDGRKALQEDALLLKERRDLKIQVEGHCDERGTTEYNLALGNRRAEAVKRYLINFGVSPKQISIISYGKEKPFCSEDNENCYKENRRGHFVSLTLGTLR